jgi:hypothetical protein
VAILPEHTEDNWYSKGLMLMLFLQMDLPPREEYSRVIDAWVDAWTKLRAHVDISEINKIHIINSHLKAYYDRTGLSLSRYQVANAGRV